jgi:hypothetical protein
MIYAALEGNEIALVYMRKMTSSFGELFHSYFARRQQEGSMRPFGPEVSLMALVGMAQHYAVCKYIHAFKELGLSDEQAIESFTRLAMNGLCLKAKRKQL